MSWATWLLFTGVPARCVVSRVRCPGPPGSCSPVCPRGVLFCVCGVLGHLAPVHRCARAVCCVACAVSWASWLLLTSVPAQCVFFFFASAVSWAFWLLFTAVPARCVVLRVRCPGPLDSCSPVCPLGVLFCVCGVLGLLAPVHRRARSVCCVGCAVSWATWLPFTGGPARCVVLRVRCPGPPGSCSPVCPLGVLCCVCGVLGHLAPVHRCARAVCCVACAVSWASWLLFTGVPARCVFFFFFWRVRCPRPPGSCSPLCPLGVLCWVCGVLGQLGSCSPMCPRGVLCCVCGVLGLLAPVHRCARSVCFFFLRVRCPGPPCSCSPVCPLGVLCWVCGVLGHLAPVHRCARVVFFLRVRCPGPPASCSPLCPLGVLCLVCSVLGHLAPVHRCARAVCCFAWAVSWATWLLFTGVPARCVVLRVRCPGPLGSCSPVCPRGVFCCVCGVLGLLAPVHRCARSVCFFFFFACAVS